jgi:hypothetical protein
MEMESLTYRSLEPATDPYPEPLRSDPIDSHLISL